MAQVCLGLADLSVTESCNHFQTQLTVVMLEEKRLHIRNPIVSMDPSGNVKKLRDEMEVCGVNMNG